jgi:cytochrome bd ubiquinol oxidase subunit II
MLYIVMAYLWGAILLYLLLGGADFGAGIIELFTSGSNRRKTRRTMYQAIGPIWEANHMWLIIAIVILFVGFPVIYTTMSIHLHIPLVIMLLGIIARGTAFAFRNYDAVVDEMQRLYTRIFVLSSFVTPFFLGIIAGSAVAGTIDTQATTFAPAYIFSWLNWFPVAVGFFTISICGFLAAIFIIGETSGKHDQARFIRKAIHFNIAAALTGLLVFIAALADGVPLFKWVFGNPFGLICISAAVISLIIMWWLLLVRGKLRIIRLFAGFQVTMILLTVTAQHYPNIVVLSGHKYLSLLEHAGEGGAIHWLGIALITGSIFILPALFYLMYSFHRRPAI